jgi:hypothetical protein
MATPKKPTANQRESRVATPTPKVVMPQTVRGMPVPTISKSTSGLSTAERNALLKELSKAQKELEGITSEAKKLTDLYNQGVGGQGENTGQQQTSTEDSGLAYQKMQDEKARQDAFSLLKDVFASYGLEELASQIEGYMREGIGTAEATIRIKQSQPYKDRFFGNELRRNAGLNVIDEASYLDLENSYSETLKAYGLQDYFGIGVTPTERKNRQKAIASVIGADISAVEFKDRVSTAVDRVKMADPATKSAFQQFYGIGEADLAKYFLDPTKALVTLKEKATAAEIGGAALGMGLSATATSAEDLAKFGINREQAQVGYSTIAQELPTAQKLSQIYASEGINYNQAEAEADVFKGLASAKRKKEQLQSREVASFSGSSGTGLGSGALSTQYLRRGSASGQF